MHTGADLTRPGRTEDRDLPTKRRSPAPKRAANTDVAKQAAELTVSLPQFLSDGSDLQFREFVADLFAAAAGMQALRRALAASIGLTAAEFSVLLAAWHLQKRGDVSIATIARHLHVAAANVTAEVGQLVARGLMTKRPHLTDARAVHVALTENGKTTLSRLAPLLRQINDRLFAGHKPSDSAILFRFVRRLADETGHATRLARSFSTDAARPLNLRQGAPRRRSHA
jgi:DNA-binding MarR family transcriptional regulator